MEKITGRPARKVQERKNKMKIKTTRKEIERQSARLYAVSYCAMQHLLQYESPFAYNSGVYGWNCDYYNIDGVIICTGYRPHGKRVDYSIITDYEMKAESALNTIKNYDDRVAVIRGYLRECLRALL
jgi:hypothetical protein